MYWTNKQSQLAASSQVLLNLDVVDIKLSVVLQLCVLFFTPDLFSLIWWTVQAKFTDIWNPKNLLYSHHLHIITSVYEVVMFSTASNLQYKGNECFIF